MWNQIRAVTALNLRSVPQRSGSSAVTVLGIAGVVVVFVGVLSMAQGFRRAMMTGGDPLTAIVLRSGASSETGSLLGLDTVRLVKDAPGIARHDGRSQASAEFAVVVRHAQAGTGRASEHHPARRRTSGVQRPRRDSRRRRPTIPARDATKSSSDEPQRASSAI